MMPATQNIKANEQSFRALVVTASASEYVDCRRAGKILGLGSRRVEQMCKQKVFATAHKPGFGDKAHWRILRTEVVAHKFNGHAGFISTDKKEQ